MHIQLSKLGCMFIHSEQQNKYLVQLLFTHATHCVVHISFFLLAISHVYMLSSPETEEGVCSLAEQKRLSCIVQVDLTIIIE